MRPKTANECIKHLKHSFSIHGITTEIVADNMPFNSFEFQKFCEKLEIKLSTISPDYSQSNRFAERDVGIVKLLIQKSAEGKEELW